MLYQNKLVSAITVFIILILLSASACAPTPTVEPAVTPSATLIPPTATPMPTATNTPVPTVGGFVIQNGQLMQLKGTELVASPFLEGLIPRELKMNGDGKTVEAYDENNNLIALWNGIEWTRAYSNWREAVPDVVADYEKKSGRTIGVAIEKVKFRPQMFSVPSDNNPELLMDFNAILIGYREIAGQMVTFVLWKDVDEKPVVLAISVGSIESLNALCVVYDGIIPSTNRAKFSSLSKEQMRKRLDERFDSLLSFGIFIRFKDTKSFTTIKEENWHPIESKEFKKFIYDEAKNREGYLWKLSEQQDLVGGKIDPADLLQFIDDIANPGGLYASSIDFFR